MEIIGSANGVGLFYTALLGRKETS
jgi:hypothetical protein